MYRIQSVRVAKSALVLATLIAAFYSVVALILIVSSAFVDPMVHQHTGAATGMHYAAFPAVIGVVFVVVWLFSYPMAALFCYLYNQVAKMTGGVEFSIS